MPRQPKKLVHYRKMARLKILQALKKFHGTLDLSPAQIAEQTGLPVQTCYFYLNNWLKEREYIESPKHGYYKITPEGIAYLSSGKGLRADT